MLRLLILVLTVLFFHPPGVASLASKSPVIQASLIDFPPHSWKDEQEIKGTYIDFLSLVEKRAGLNIAIEVFPFLRAIDRVQDGSADFTIIPAVDNPKGLYGEKIPFNKVRYILLSRKKKPFCSLPEVRGEIGRLRGGCLNLLDERKVHYFEVSSSYEQGLTMLQRGRLDGFCGVETGMTFWMKILGLDTRALSKFVMLEKEQYIYFSRKFSKVQFEKFEKAATELINEGALEKIQEKYREPSGFLRAPDCR